MLDPAAYSGHVASAAPRLALDFARERGGEEVARRVADGMFERGLDLTPLGRGEWTPFGWHLALVEEIEKGLGEDALWDLGMHNARNAHRFVPGLAAVLSFVKPARLIQSAPMVWRTYADFGAIDSTASRGGGRLSLSGFRPHEAFCGTLGGFFAGLLTRVGAHACAVEHTECMLRSAKACVFTGTWT